ncbi:MAG TPA: hypothetical protein VIL09_02840 [Microvirga sp.]|jgi:hypothetical protein
MRRPILILAALLPLAAQAHHPGSHANRRADGQVMVEVVATASDSCIRIASVRLGTPATVAPPPGSTPVTARLVREGGACATVVKALREEVALPVPASARQILLYVEGADGSVESTERVPIR